MYILNWNPTSNVIEASFGGYLTAPEADVFFDEFRELLIELGPAHFSVTLDYAMVPRMDSGVKDRLDAAREASLFAGATCVTYVARTEAEAHSLIDERLQAVLEGKEQYVAYAAA